MKKFAGLLVLAIAGVAVAACADSGSGSTVRIEVDPGGADFYTQERVKTEAGEVQIEFNNRQWRPHDVAIENSDGNLLGQTDVVAEHSSEVTVDLEKGEYTYYCTVPGHRATGQVGTLIVE